MGTACSLITTSLSTSSVVAQLAPGVQTSPHGMTVPKIGERPRVWGRLYSNVISVPFTTWNTPACSLARTWAASWDGGAEGEDDDPGRNESEASGLRIARERSAVAGVDGGADVVQGLPGGVESGRERASPWQISHIRAMPALS